jgi:CBS domain-containing protein
MNGQGQASARSVAGITAGQVMTAPVVTVGPETSVGQIAEILTTKRFSGVPVVDGGGAVLGLVSERDLLARSGRTARDVMTTSVISVTTDTDIEQVRHMLVDAPIRRLPVLSAGRLVGIISRHDLVGRMVEWACGVCGETVRGAHPPLVCPKCGGGADRFILQEQPPGP